MSLVLESLPVLLRAAIITVVLAVVSMLIGLVLGLLSAVARIVKNRPANWIAGAYVSLIRGTPLLVQIYLVYYGLPQVGIRMGPLTSGILALSVNVGSYLSESYRAAILSVDKGQIEAAYSIGMTYTQAMRRVIIPQSIRTALPTFGNSYIGLLKDTSLVSVITVRELLQTTQLIISRTFQPLLMYAEVALIYWVISSAFGILQQKLEQRSARHVRI